MYQQPSGAGDFHQSSNESGGSNEQRIETNAVPFEDPQSKFSVLLFLLLILFLDATGALSTEAFDQDGYKIIGKTKPSSLLNIYNSFLSRLQ